MFCIHQKLSLPPKLIPFIKQLDKISIKMTDKLNFKNDKIVLFSLTNCQKNPLGVSAWKSNTKQAVPVPLCQSASPHIQNSLKIAKITLWARVPMYNFLVNLLAVMLHLHDKWLQDYPWPWVGWKGLPAVNFTNNFAPRANAPAWCKWHKRCCWFSPTFSLKFFCRF